jgi:hypothetical protein
MRAILHSKPKRCILKSKKKETARVRLPLGHGGLGCAIFRERTSQKLQKGPEFLRLRLSLNTALYVEPFLRNARGKLAVRSAIEF